MKYELVALERKDYWIKKNKILKINTLIKNQDRDLIPNYFLNGNYRINCNNLTNCHISIKKLRKNVKMPQNLGKIWGIFLWKEKTFMIVSLRFNQENHFRKSINKTASTQKT